jgi:hypothetical protein
VPIVKGIGLGHMKLGDVISESLLTIYKRGDSAGIGVAGGVSTVLNSRMEACRPECASCKNRGNEPPSKPNPLPPGYPPLATIPPNALNQMFGGGWR